MEKSCGIARIMPKAVRKISKILGALAERPPAARGGGFEKNAVLEKRLGIKDHGADVDELRLKESPFLTNIFDRLHNGNKRIKVPTRSSAYKRYLHPAILPR